MINDLSFLLPTLSNGVNRNGYNNNSGNTGTSFDDLLSVFTNNNSSAKKSGGNSPKNDIYQTLNFLQQTFINIDDYAAMIDPMGAISNPDNSESFVTGNGPLPRFLHEMDVRLHLNATQRQALRDIAIANKDAVKTPETVQKIAMELQLAGI
jgi:hypothetical protein